ncbi:MAG: SDR family NAD(P)-dependent oxidoreductase [Hyphomonadaceae bacterium]|nr:SDR family NAD(P)-dependent oxidoreductase [Hyphomonadaceae bacterium]
MRALKRQEARFDTGALKGFYQGKRVLITGAAGSVGSALALQLAELGCTHLALLDHFDHGLLDIVEQVNRVNPRVEVVDALCDIRDRERLQYWMNRIEPEVVIHAAALKHVHLGERHPTECVLTNLVGVRNTLAAAAAAGATDFMLVSSDKAASPVCVMGATKRLAEMHLIGFQMECRSSIRVRSVRFGNVMGSQGSVAPRFMAQIAAGGPLQVTHPDMQRFFMSSEEAVGLILSVTALEDRGAQNMGAYYMEMGEPVSILELGREMIERSGRKIEIEFTGLRPGEKLKEELFDQYETVNETALPGVFRVTPMEADAYVSSADVAYLENMARTMESAVVRQRVFSFLDARLGREEPAVG